MLTRLLVAGMLLSGCAWAQEGDNENDGGEASHGVARISLMKGDVAVRRGDSASSVAAAVNGPLVAGDQLLTGPAARAEIQFDWATFVRLGTDTQVRLAALENNHYQVQLARGTVTLAVIRDSNAQVEVDTPNMAFQPHERGSYRISVTDDGQSQVTVRAGAGDTYTPNGTEPVPAGQTMMVRGPVSDPEFQTVQAIPVDEWDRWNEQRDQQLLKTRSYQYVSPDMAGAGELDSYGHWVYVPPYGWVWSPNGVGPDWAPYRDGRWAWLDWYGWTWVGYEPWGWAPYHYGRWFFGAGVGWCWYPGAMYSHYYWRPALVAFFGFGPGVGVGVGFGSIGWFPLGPHEAFSPWYGRGWYGFRGGATYVNNVRAMSIAGMRSTYINARVGNGISGVGAGAFGQGGRPGALSLNGQARLSMMRGPVPVAPTAASLRMSDRTTRIAPAPLGRGQFYSPHAAAPSGRVSFSVQRQGVARYAGQSIGTPAVHPGGSGPGAVQGWRAVPSQSSGQAPANAVSTGYRPQASPDWRTFGHVSQTPNGTTPRTQGVRINPPIVRERSQSKGSSGHSSGGGGHASGHSSGGGGGHSHK